jgi:hypothetical protein
MQCPLFVSDFLTKIGERQQILVKLYDIKFHKYTLSGYRSGLRLQRDGHMTLF